MSGRQSAAVAIAFAAAVVLAGCSSRQELEERTRLWQEKINAAIPVGTDLGAARAWFESQGLKVQPRLDSPKEFGVRLDTLRAREWYCDRWTLSVTVRASPDGKVARYDFGNVGNCL